MISFVLGYFEICAAYMLQGKIYTITDVKEVHDLHAWSLDGDKNVGSCHIVVKPKANTESVKKQVRDCFTAQHIQHVTIELEAVSENCPHQDC